MNLLKISNDIIKITKKRGCTYSDAERETLKNQLIRCIRLQFEEMKAPLARLGGHTPEERDAHYDQFVEKLLDGTDLTPDDFTTELEAALYEIDRIFGAVKNREHPPMVYIVQGFMHQNNAGKLCVDQAYDNTTYLTLYNASAAPNPTLTLAQWNAIQLDLLKVLLKIKPGEITPEEDEYKRDLPPLNPSPAKKPRRN